MGETRAAARAFCPARQADICGWRREGRRVGGSRPGGMVQADGPGATAPAGTGPPAAGTGWPRTPASPLAAGWGGQAW